MTEKEINDLISEMEQLAGDVRQLTYAIKDLTDVNERIKNLAINAIEEVE